MDKKKFIISLVFLIVTMSFAVWIRLFTNTDPVLIDSSQVNPQITTVSLKDKATQLASDIHMLASNTDYINALSTNSEMASLMQKISSQNLSNPTNIYKISGIDKSYKTVFQYLGEELPNFENKRVEDICKNRIISSIPTQLSASHGSVMLATMSLLYVDDVFLYPDLTETEVYLLLYDGDYNICVIYTPKNDGIVLANASIVTHSMLTEIQKNGLSDSIKLGSSFVGISLEEITN